MPEPSHRMPPTGFSALNYAPPPNFGNPSYESVARICQHFEAKCGGRYASDSPCFSYVFEMSREVQSQLTALKAAEEKRINSRLSSSVSSRWEDSFGPSSTLSKDLKEVNITITPADSGAVTPAAVSEAVSTLVERIRAMERALAEERGERASREGSYQEALRSHMAASGAASDADRSEYAKQQAEIAHQAQEALVTIREQRDLVMQQVIQEKDAEYSKMVEGYKKQLNDVQLELLNNRQHTLNTEAQWRRRLEDAEQRERVRSTASRSTMKLLLPRLRSQLLLEQSLTKDLAAKYAYTRLSPLPRQRPCCTASWRIRRKRAGGCVSATARTSVSLKRSERPS
ncbi:unnamed protein product [Chrysoparadoxa australica]